MSSLGVDSPMFDYIEQISGVVRSTPTPSGGAGGESPIEQKKEEAKI